jgi:predicted ATP-binding protein involved in virulence
VRKLTRVEVTGLLAQFDHAVNFSAGWDFVILHGPNGVGKTKLLELIKAASNGAVHDLQRIPFDSAQLFFDDGTQLQVSKTGQLSFSDLGTEELDESNAHITFQLTGPERSPVSWTSGVITPALTPRILRYIDDLPGIRRTGSRTWSDIRTAQRLTIDDVVQRYPRILRLADVEHEPFDEALVDFFKHFEVHLIETQRLLTFERAETRLGRDVAAQQISTVAEYSRDVTLRLKEALAQNSRTSQELDSSFPRRLLSEEALPADVTDDLIRNRYEEQNALRNRLSEISVLDTTQEVPLPSRNLQPWERRVLWTYLEDSASKLATFQNLLDKVRLLRDIVNGRFLHKQMIINQDSGFTFRTNAGHAIGPDRLSSGEQHELVLVYELLFRVRPGSLVLIDEPEISLHIGWQQEFLNDIASIASIAALRFMVATHSPQIIHKWWDRTVPLSTDEFSRESML